ncbi:alpha/beta hydrolase family protein [Piscinibacterium candidicorallinum]|uniref:Alpha/beta hydrolase family protein n=1 Tax=Piscinibacterium candidicorallinum TaxID=1793872 RepID=A0ABV7H3J5_9BURK
MTHQTRRQHLQWIASALALGALPGVKAQAAVAPRDLVWTDRERNREVPVRLRMPQQAAGPVILFSHGLGGNLDAGTAWGEAWAAAGYVVLHMQHAGSDTPSVRAGGARKAMSADAAAQRVGDVRFVLDELARQQAAGELRGADLKRIGMSGHSFGAWTTQAMAGQQLNPRIAALNEPRLSAFIAFSPSAGRGPTEISARFAGVRAPFFALTGTLDGDVAGTGATPENRQAVFDALPTGDKYELLLADADHMTFGGQRMSRGVRRALGRDRKAVTDELEPTHHALIALLTTRFWDAYLREQPAAKRALLPPVEVKAPDRWRAK